MPIELPYNLSDPIEREKLTSKHRDWIAWASPEHQLMCDKWSQIDSRLNGDYTIGGFTTDTVNNMINANNGTTNPTETKPTWIRVPRSRPNLETAIGQFLSTDRTISIKPRTPHDRAIARILQERIRYIQDTADFKNLVYFPTVEGMQAKGLHWFELKYDAARFGTKKFTLDEVSARDVLVDPRSRGMMFKTAEFELRRFILEEDKAEEAFGDYAFFDIDKMQRTSAIYDAAYSYNNADQRRNHPRGKVANRARWNHRTPRLERNPSVRPSIRYSIGLLRFRQQTR